ncbi:MAG: hypothetical protein WBB65_14800 [Anaerolineales bacterium]
MADRAQHPLPQAASALCRRGMVSFALTSVIEGFRSLKYFGQPGDVDAFSSKADRAGSTLTLAATAA